LQFEIPKDVYNMYTIFTIAILGGQVGFVVAASLGVHRLVHIGILAGIQALLAAQDLHFQGQDCRHRLPLNAIVIVITIVVGVGGHEGDCTWVKRIHRRTQCSGFETGGCRRIAMCPALEIRQNHRSTDCSGKSPNQKCRTKKRASQLYEIVRQTAGAFFLYGILRIQYGFCWLITAEYTQQWAMAEINLINTRKRDARAIGSAKMRLR